MSIPRAQYLGRLKYIYSFFYCEKNWCLYQEGREGGRFTTQVNVAKKELWDKVESFPATRTMNTIEMFNEFLLHQTTKKWKLFLNEERFKFK